MHAIAMDQAGQLVISTQFVAENIKDPVWPLPLFRIHIRTGDDTGVILQFCDPRTLQLVASAIRELLEAHRDATKFREAQRRQAEALAADQRTGRRPARPVARTFDGF